jgi:hypothetical protein
VWAEDPAPHVTTAEVVLTILGPTMLATPGRVKALLEHLASNAIRNDVEAGEVAAACIPWLAVRFPGVARAVEVMPSSTDPDWYEPWVAGVCAGLGHWPNNMVSVPAPPFAFIREDKSLDGIKMSGNLHVRPDTINRLYGGHRAN